MRCDSFKKRDLLPDCRTLPWAHGKGKLPSLHRFASSDPSFGTEVIRILEYILVMIGKIITAGYLYLVQFSTAIHLQILDTQNEMEDTLLQEHRSQRLSSHLRG